MAELTKAESAWCDWALRYEATHRKIETYEQGISLMSFEGGMKAGRARVRRELLESLPAIARSAAAQHGHLDVPLHLVEGNTEEAVAAATADRLIACVALALDKICPEED